MRTRLQGKFVQPTDVVTPPRAQSPDGMVCFNRFW